MLQNLELTCTVTWLPAKVPILSSAKPYSVFALFPQGSHRCVSRWSVWRPPEISSGPPTPALWASRSSVSDGSYFCVCLCSTVHSTEVSASLCSPGLWPDGSDGTDINAVCRSSDKSLLVTGDDFGKVHLFSYPCSQFRVGCCSQSHQGGDSALWFSVSKTYCWVFFLSRLPAMFMVATAVT